MSDPLPDSKTHRLCFFEHAPAGHRHEIVPAFVADEVEELRAFVRFLYPPKGQDRFRLCRPDLNELRWIVFDQLHHETYAYGSTPRAAVKAADYRLAAETNSTPFCLTSSV